MRVASPARAPSLSLPLVLRRLLVAPCLLAVISCAAPERAVQHPPPPLQPFAAESVRGGAAWIPWATLDIDARGRGGPAPSPDLADGDGFALRGGRYDDALGMEFVYATTEHDERGTGAQVRSHAAYVDLSDRWELTYGRVFLWAGVGVGAGVVYFDWDRTYDSDLTGLWQGHGILALQLGEHASIEARVAGFLAAHPTDTVGTGALVMLGGSLAF